MDRDNFDLGAADDGMKGDADRNENDRLRDEYLETLAQLRASDDGMPLPEERRPAARVSVTRAQIREFVFGLRVRPGAIVAAAAIAALIFAIDVVVGLVR